MARPKARRRLAPPKLTYTTRVHLKRRARAIDYRFIAAVVALAAVTAGIVRMF